MLELILVLVRVAFLTANGTPGSHTQILARKSCKGWKAGVMERMVIMKKASWRKGLPSLIQRGKLLKHRQKRPGLTGTS